MSGWQLDYRPSAELPPLAWLARVRPALGTVTVDCGLSVRREAVGFAEGAWAGPAEVAALAGATTVFGSGIVAGGDELVVVPPSHNLEAVYSAAQPSELLIANSLVALLVASGLALDPDADYPARFGLTRRGIASSPIALPTLGAPIRLDFFENVAIDRAGRLVQRPKPREAPFASFADYRDRLRAALAALMENAAGYETVVALSSGYDSTALAALVGGVGGRRAVGLRTARLFRRAGPLEIDDSGAPTAERLGLAMTMAERLAYRERADLPEAEFLASGMSGEEVVFSGLEESLRRSLLITGTWPAWIWIKGAPNEPNLERDDMSGSSMTEFRLRLDCIYVPLAFFGATAQPSIAAISDQDDMRRYSVGGAYDRPIPRRLAEEAGVPRGSFAARKIGVSATLHTRPGAAFAPATLAAIEAFAAAEGRAPAFRRRRRTGRADRALIKLARRLGAHGLAARLNRRRQARTHFDRHSGGIVLRWAVALVAPRYRPLATPSSSRANDIAIGG